MSDDDYVRVPLLEHAALMAQLAEAEAWLREAVDELRDAGKPTFAGQIEAWLAANVATPPDPMYGKDEDEA